MMRRNMEVQGSFLRSLTLCEKNILLLWTYPYFNDFLLYNECNIIQIVSTFNTHLSLRPTKVFSLFFFSVQKIFFPAALSHVLIEKLTSLI